MGDWEKFGRVWCWLLFWSECFLLLFFSCKRLFDAKDNFMLGGVRPCGTEAWGKKGGVGRYSNMFCHFVRREKKRGVFLLGY